jgi:type 1 glutamine amidotransferase
MKKIISFLIIIMMVASFTYSQEQAEVLIFAKTSGYYHTSIPAGMKCIVDACSTEDIKVDTTRDAMAFTENSLKKYKVVVFLNTTGDILDEMQQEALISYVRAGGGFVGVHAATDTEYDWPWYNKLVGAYFLSHPEQQQATIRVIDKNHPATSMLPEQWVRTDEWYNFKDMNTDVKVLAYLDEATYKGGENGEKHPFIWYHEYEGGRAFYTGVGHRDDNYLEPLVQQHLLGAIKWAGKIE